MYKAFLYCSVFLVGCLLWSLRSGFGVENSPFMFPDSFDWLVNGFAYSGIWPERYQISHRGMLLTLVLGALYRYKLVDYALLIGTVFHISLTLILYWATQTVASRFVALSAALLYLLSGFCLAQSAYLGADVLSNFFLSTFLLVLFKLLTQPSHHLLLPLALCAALGVHAQYVFPILLPTITLSIAIALLRSDSAKLRSVLSSRTAIITVLIGAAISLLLLWPRTSIFDLIYEERVQHTSLISPFYGGFIYYAFGLFAAFSWPVVIAALYGAYTTLTSQKSDQRNFALFLILWISNVFVFLRCSMPGKIYVF